MGNYKLTLIIPVYNSESYLKECVESVINQSIGFSNIELILIDDNSTDNSKNIITDYSNKYSNVKPIFLTENSGSASYPRNLGIKKSTAPYIIFLDSDDELYEDYCEILFNVIESHDVDIVNCDRTSKLNNVLFIPQEIDKINYEQKYLYGDRKLFLEHTVWGNIYNSSFLKNNNIWFLDMLFEDLVYSVECIVKTKKDVIQLFNYPGYIYFIENEYSVTHDVSLKTLNDFLKCISLIYNLIKEKYSIETSEELLNNMINMVFFILSKLDDKSEGIKSFYRFQMVFEVNLTPSFKLWNIINNRIKNKHFNQALFMIKMMSVFYNNKRIRNFLFVHYSGVKRID